MAPDEFKNAMIYYGEINAKGMPDFKPHVLEFWYKKIGHLEKIQLKQVMDDLICNPFWPSLGEILEKLNPKLDIKTEANLISGKIFDALTRYGSSQLDLVEAQIGPAGWEVVRLSGGWLQVCEITNNQVPTAKAQWRQLAEAVLTRGEHEDYSSKQLPCAENKQISAAFEQLGKQTEL